MPTPLLAQIWERDEHDWYVEPRWVIERLFDAEPMEGRVWDGAAGGGQVVQVAREHGLKAFGTDIVSRGPGIFPQDFMKPSTKREAVNFVSNPPYKLCVGEPGCFVDLALQRTTGVVALVLPNAWAWGSKRASWLKTTPLYKVYAVTPRPSMLPGTELAKGKKAGGGKKDYCVVVWRHGYVGEPKFGWLKR